MAVEVFMPKMGMGMQEGTLVEWLKQAGDTVMAGEAIARIETNKVVTDLEAPVAGILANILVEAATVVPVGTTLAYIFADGEELPPQVVQPGRAAESGQITFAGFSEVKQEMPLKAGTGEPRFDRPSAVDVVKGHLTPVAKRTASELGLNADEIAAAFPGQRVNREDVLRWAEAKSGKAIPAVATSTAPEIRPMSSRRKTIAQRMSASLRESAQLTLIRGADVTELVAARQRLVEEAERYSRPRPTYTDILIKAMALAVPASPIVNARLHGDNIEIMPTVNIGVAVDTEEGLIVPVVKDVGALSLAEITAKVQDLAERARQGRLLPEEVEDSTITITNLGSEGIDAFTPILNPGEVAILGVGRIRPVWSAVGKDTFQLRSEITLSLTIDHRIVDGVPAARYLGRIAELLERPDWLK